MSNRAGAWCQLSQNLFQIKCQLPDHISDGMSEYMPETPDKMSDRVKIIQNTWSGGDHSEKVTVHKCSFPVNPRSILVGGLEHLDYFSHQVGNFITPPDELSPSFFRGLVGQPPSSHNPTQIYKKRWCPSSDDPDEKGPKGSRLNQSSHHWLVVWTIFSIYWECHNPNWRTHIFIYFSEGWVETTNQTNIWTISIILLDH